VSLTSLMERVDALETRFNGHETVLPHPHHPEAGTWQGADFSI
jgi:hypothetical protein